MWDITRLMKLIRFPLMPEDDFENHVPASGFLHETQINNIRKFYMDPKM
jgi:hypothetical protein